ncbi:MAG: tetratricopeptide repeat protein [Candidatus Gastranaerophilales bacterium]|nr:tetratricopeptide repeat protein [Candidatus Gastranaerophilales bacterium]
MKLFNIIILAIVLSFTITANVFADDNISDFNLVSINAKAYGLYLKGNYDFSFAVYKKGLNLYPHSASLYDGIGAVYIKKQQFGQAYKNFNKASLLDTSNSLYKIHAQDSIYKSYINKLNQSRYLFSNAFMLSPLNPVIQKNFENIRKQKHRSLEMIYYVIQNPKDLNLSRGNEAFWKKEFNKAQKFYQKSIKLRPKNYEAFNNLGLVYLETTAINKAVENFKKAANLNPKLAQAYNNLGIAYSKLNKFNEANKNFDMSIKTGKNYFPAYNNKAVCQINSIFENIDPSIRYLETIVKLEASNILAKQSLGQFLLLNESYNAAIIVYKSGLELAYNNFNFLKQYADCLYAAGQYQEAVNYYKKAISINAENSDIFVNLAKAQGKNGDNYDAFVSYQTSLRINPKNANAYKYFGLYLLGQKRKAEAKGILQKYIQLSPKSYDCLYISKLIKK